MQQIITEEDLHRIAGRFIVELDFAEDKARELTKTKPDALEFFFVKRVRFICLGGDGVIQSDLFGNTFTWTKEKFVERFNASGQDKTRYHRLLYADELKLLFKFIAERNY